MRLHPLAITCMQQCCFSAFSSDYLTGYLMSLLMHCESITVDVKAGQYRGRGLAVDQSLVPNIGLYVFISVSGVNWTLYQKLEAVLCCCLTPGRFKRKHRWASGWDATRHSFVCKPVCFVCVCCLSYLESLSWPTICAWDKAERWNCDCEGDTTHHSWISACLCVMCACACVDACMRILHNSAIMPLQNCFFQWTLSGPADFLLIKLSKIVFLQGRWFPLKKKKEKKTWKTPRNHQSVSSKKTRRPTQPRLCAESGAGSRSRTPTVTPSANLLTCCLFEFPPPSLYISCRGVWGGGVHAGACYEPVVDLFIVCLSSIMPLSAELWCSQTHVSLPAFLFIVTNLKHKVTVVCWSLPLAAVTWLGCSPAGIQSPWKSRTHLFNARCHWHGKPL